MNKQVAVFSPFYGIGEKVLIGIANFFQKKEDWSMRPFQLGGRFEDLDFDPKDYEGAIVVDSMDSLPEQINNLEIPVVKVFDRTANNDTPLVSVDHHEVGALAAQHLLGRGFKNLAFVGGIEFQHAKKRYNAFKEHLNSKDVNMHLFSESFPTDCNLSDNDKSWNSFRNRLMTWIDSLPKPIGIYAIDDWKAFETQLCCRKLGIRIPEDVAIIGVNDDELACQISIPSLTSIRIPFERIGFESGKSVLQLLENGHTPDTVIKPIGLVTRESTNTFAVTDKVVEEALRYMQRESTKPIRVEEVLKHVGVSRSLLERRFRGEIGRTPLVEMRRQRVERARGLLADTELAINKIAEMCGFASNIRFTTVFREQVGVTPTEFRLQMQNDN